MIIFLVIEKMKNSNDHYCAFSKENKAIAYKNMCIVNDIDSKLIRIEKITVD